MSEYLITEINAADNVSVRPNTRIVNGGGANRLEHLTLDEEGVRKTVPADGLFVLIGARPHTNWLPADVQRDAAGYILTGPDLVSEGSVSAGRPPLMLETSMPGVFAAGDARHGSVKRVASAVGAGAIAIQSVHEYLKHERTRTARVV